MIALARESFPANPTDAWAITPIPIPAKSAVGMLSIRAMTAAVSAKRSTFGPRDPSLGTPTRAVRRKMVSPASPPAITQATVCTRFTGMPSSDARSAFSADARSAIPIRVYRRKAARASTAAMAMPKEKGKSPEKTFVPTLNLNDLNGVGTKEIGCPPLPSQIGIFSDRKARPWDTPIVTTVRISRGDFAKRRITRRSTSPPITAPPKTAIGKATTQGARFCTSSMAASTPGAAPRAAAAKLMIRFVR